MSRPAFLCAVPLVVLCTAFSAPRGPQPATQPTVDLVLAFSAPATTAANEPFVWTFSVTNDGPNDSPSVAVSAPLTMGVTYVSASSTDFSCASTGGMVTCTAGVLPATKTFTVDVTVNAPSTIMPISLMETATVSIPSMNATDSNPTTTATATTSIVPVDLAITKTDLVDPVAAGAALGYTLTVTNGATVSAHDVVVTDAIPAGTTFVSASGTGWSCAFASGTITCTRPEIDSSASRTPTINVVLTAPSTPTTVQNTAYVSAEATDPSTMNNSSTATTTITQPPPGMADVSVSVMNGMNPVDTGAALTYTVAIANAGPDPAAGVQLVGSLPSTTTFVSASGVGWACQQAGTTLTCQPSGTLAVGTAQPILVTLTAPSMAGTVSASFVVVSTTQDPNIANNTATVSTLVINPTHVNQPPTITINGPLSTLQNMPVSLNGTVVIADPDSGADDVELDVTGTKCVLTLASTTGLTFLEGDGVLDPVLRVRGPVAALSAALSMGSLTPYPDYAGAASLALHVDDLGHTGTGGPRTADATLQLVVLPVDEPPIPGDDELTVLANVTTTLDVLASAQVGQPGQMLFVAAVSQGAHGAVAITGSQVAYTPKVGFVGDDAFTYTVSDGSVSAIGNVVVHVKPYTPPTTDRFSGGCSAAGRGGRPDASLLALLLVLAYGMIPRSRNHSHCARSAANTDVG